LSLECHWDKLANIQIYPKNRPPADNMVWILWLGWEN